jgi:AcrR family transcriptional regulator
VNKNTEILKEPRRPVQKRSKERVRKILDAADQIINESGWGAASSHAIAKRAGVPPAGVYHFFPDRFMIYDALVNRNANEFRQIFFNRIDEIGVNRWEDLVRILVQEIADYCLHNQAAKELSFGCDGEFSTRWCSSTHSTELATIMQELYDIHFVLPKVDKLEMKFQLVSDFVMAGFTQAVGKRDPMDYEVLDEMQDAIVAYMATWVGEMDLRD